MVSADVWRYLTLAAAFSTVVAGVVCMSLGGPIWPSCVGAVACVLLGEFWRYRLRKSGQ